MCFSTRYFNFQTVFSLGKVLKSFFSIFYTLGKGQPILCVRGTDLQAAWLLERGDIMQIFKPNWSPLCVSIAVQGLRTSLPSLDQDEDAILTHLDVGTNCSGQDAQLGMQQDAGGFLPSFLLLAC